jgi:hypothetical protein
MSKKNTSSIDIYSLLVNEYQIRTETLRGEEHWVLPVVMMVEGVHHGSLGPLLYTAEELGRITPSWNGIPVTIQHPQLNGVYTSANLPEHADGIVGYIYHATMDGDKLKAEAWINISTLKDVSLETYEYIIEQKALDVSVGVFSEEVNVPGEFNGERYRAAATNLRPDHLALLPGAQGACSWDDGCGIRNNQNHNKMIKPDKDKYIADFIANKITDNEKGYREIMQSIQTKLNAMDNGQKYHYLEDLFDGKFVYRVMGTNSQSETFYQQNYKINDGQVEFDGDPVQVRKEVTFPVMKLTRNNFSNKTNKQMERKLKNNKDCTCNVDALIENQATKFTEEDREWLSTLSEGQLEKLMPKEEEVKPAANSKKEEKKEEVTPAANAQEGLIKKNEDGTISINGKSIDQYVKESLGKETDTDKFIDNFMPEGLKGQMKAGLKMYQERRQTMIKGIVDNSKFKAEQLKSWSDEDLQALYESVAEGKGDYSLNSSSFSANGNAGTDEDSADEIAAMLSFETRPEKKEEKK